MVKAILRETVYFSGAESLYRELEALDPVFRVAAKVIDCEYDYETTICGDVSYWQGTLLLEAELDASPEA